MPFAIILVMDAPQDNLLGPEVVAEFEGLIIKLDNHSITRPEWDRFKAIITIATLDGGDADAGSRGYQLSLEKWRISRWFDGHE